MDKSTASIHTLNLNEMTLIFYTQIFKHNLYYPFLCIGYLARFSYFDG